MLQHLLFLYISSHLIQSQDSRRRKWLLLKLNVECLLKSEVKCSFLSFFLSLCMYLHSFIISFLLRLTYNQISIIDLLHLFFIVCSVFFLLFCEYLCSQKETVDFFCCCEFRLFCCFHFRFFLCVVVVVDRVVVCTVVCVVYFESNSMNLNK